MNLPIYNHTITSLLWNRKQAFEIAQYCLSVDLSMLSVCVSFQFQLSYLHSLSFSLVPALVGCLLYNQMHMASLCSAFDTAHLDVLSNHIVCIYVRFHAKQRVKHTHTRRRVREWAYEDIWIYWHRSMQQHDCEYVDICHVFKLLFAAWLNAGTCKSFDEMCEHWAWHRKWKWKSGTQ